MKRSRYFRFLAFTGAALLTAGMFTPARAQDPDDLKRAVARISLMNGEVSVRRGDSGDWVAGVVNAPLMVEDRISTGANSRAEVQFDSANMLRIGANAEVRLVALEYGRYQMEIARGLVTFRVLRSSDADVEVDTPNVSVRPSKQGTYRISVSEAGESEITARAGEVEVFTPRGSQWVRSGQTMLARGTASDPEFQIVAAVGYDDWDRWSDSRDRSLTQSVSARYVPQGVYGAEDLDAYGNWVSVAGYGQVWRPVVVADWAPYYYGRWVWEDWYGWTWVSYDPWGWAPYHYGRWFHDIGYGWCWYPGLFGARHYWSPGLVAFFGFGHGIGVGFGFGNVGWVPLAPYEVFHPWWGRGFYGRSGRFNQNINITNVNITNNYRNARVRNGINAVSEGDFRSGRFNNVARVTGNQVRDAGLVRGQMPIAPSNANLHFSDRQVTNIPRTNENARFFQHQQPSPVQRVPFAQQAGRAAEMPNRVAAAGPAVSSRPAAAQAAPSRDGVRPNQSEAAGGWRRFGAPAGQNATPQGALPRNENNAARGMSQSPAMRNDRPSQAPVVNQAPAPRNENRGGWQRFGDPGSSNRAPQQQSTPPPGRSEFRSDPGSGLSSAPRYNAPGSRPENLRIAPPVVRERPIAPSYSAPRYSAPTYNAPRPSAPSYSAPRPSAPSYSAPRGPSGGGGGGAPRGSGGGGGGNRGGHGR